VNWFELKDWLELSTGLDRDSLHIYAGVGVQLAVALLFRRSLASLLPWSFVAVAALANEFYDFALVPDTSELGLRHYDEAVRDIWNTLLLPSLLMVIARFWPGWLTGRSKTDAEVGQSGGSHPTL
jgi:hypothetical protein